MNVLIVVDMQNDFIDGALGTDEAVAIIPDVVEKIRGFDGCVFFTRDTHGEEYLETQEGRKLPVKHCIKGTWGWEIRPEIDALRECEAVDKGTFGSIELGRILIHKDEELKKFGESGIESVTLIGVCTDICVISNALYLKMVLPEIRIIVDSECCAGTSVNAHKNALEAMKICQVEIV